jgi:hypothetical protein
VKKNGRAGEEEEFWLGVLPHQITFSFIFIGIYREADIAIPSQKHFPCVLTS